MTLRLSRQIAMIFRVLLALLFLGLAVLPVFAQSADPAPAGPPLDFASLAAQFVALAGAGSLISAIVNALKTAGIVRDGQATTVVTGLNILGIAGLLALQVFSPAADIAGLDAAAGSIATVLTVLAGFVVQMGGSKLFHTLFKGAPLIGKTFSGAK